MKERRKGAPKAGKIRSPAVSPPPAAATVDDWLARHSRAILTLVVLGSLAVRGVYFAELTRTPLIELHRWDQTDMYYYDHWGRQIAQGDWLSRSITPPMHDWQRVVAETYFGKHPALRTTLTAQGDRANPPPDPDTALWEQWTGGRRFYEDPLYPYLLGLTYRFIGDDVRFVFAWQMALGVLSTVLVWWLTRRTFGHTAAAVAAGLAVLCAPLMYYELILLRETTILFAGLALIWITDRALSRGGWGWYGFLGAALALACLLKSSFVLLAAGITAVVILGFRGRGRELKLPAIAAVAGFTIALVPLIARNVSLGVAPVSLASSGGLTFILSNDVQYRPEQGFHVDIPKVAELMGESQGKLVPAVAVTLRSHTVASYAALLERKLDRTWHWFEIPNDDNFYYMRLHAPLLGKLPVTFWLCGPLALVGLAIATRRSIPMRLLVLLLAFAFIPLLVFYVQGRFRVPLMAVLIPFTAYAIVTLIEWAAGGRYLRAAGALSVVLAIAAWTGRPLQGRPLIRTADWLAPFNVLYDREVRAALAAHDPGRAAAAYMAFFQYEPDTTRLSSPNDTVALVVLAQMHLECATHFKNAGEQAQAHDQFGKARAIVDPVLRRDPSIAEARIVLADALFQEQSFERAATEYRSYLQARPNDPTALAHFGIALIASGHLDEAVAAFRRAVEIQPGNADAHRNLGNALFDNRDAAGAAEHAQQAIALRPSDSAAHNLLGRAWAVLGRLDRAKQEFLRAIELDPANAEAREDLKKIGP